MSIFSVWAVYDHPKDYPDVFIARRWEVEVDYSDPMKAVPIERATDDIITSKVLNAIRYTLRHKGLVRLGSLIGDDPFIIETWI